MWRLKHVGQARGVGFLQPVSVEPQPGVRRLGKLQALASARTPTSAHTNIRSQPYRWLHTQPEPLGTLPILMPCSNYPTHRISLPVDRRSYSSWRSHGDDFKKELCYSTATSRSYSPSSYSRVIRPVFLGTPNDHPVNEAIVVPKRESVWQRGDAAYIEWDPKKVESNKIRVELRRRGSVATTVIGTEEPNSGKLEYKKVPWGMMTGDGYYVLITAGETRLSSELFCIGTSPRN